MSFSPRGSALPQTGLLYIRDEVALGQHMDEATLFTS